MDVKCINIILSCNVIGVFLCVWEVIKCMDKGSIVNVLLGVLWIGLLNEYLDYVVFKGVFDIFIIGFVKEVVSKGIWVNVVRFGFIYIDMYCDGGEVNCVDCLKFKLLLGCGGEVDEVVLVIYFLVSE